MTADTDIIDGTSVDLVAYEPAPPAALFGTTEPTEIVTKATAVANALADVIAKRGLFASIQGRKHVTVDGWQLLGVMLGVTAVCVGTEPVDGGYKATVEARTADGRVIGRADALCTKHENRGPWKTADDYARLSMAQTRATSKALKGPLGFVVSLAGYEATPAEEMTFVEPAASARDYQEPTPTVTASAPEATEQTATVAQRRLILAKANENGLPHIDFLNAIRMGCGLQAAAEEITDEQAAAASKRILDRLPARYVDGVLKQITDWIPF